MITLTPVLEPWSADCPFWPVEQARFLVAVPRRPTPLQVGTVVWALIGRSVSADDLSITAADADEAIETYVARTEGHFAPGGLRVTAGGVVVDPGCCVGLDEWRDWLRVIDGGSIDLGHDPDVMVEHHGPVVRVRTASGPYASDESQIDIPREALPRLLSTVQEDLAGFLTGLRPWAYGVSARLAETLTVAVDRRLQILAPLDHPEATA